MGLDNDAGFDGSVGSVEGGRSGMGDGSGIDWSGFDTNVDEGGGWSFDGGGVSGGDVASGGIGSLAGAVAGAVGNYDFGGNSQAAGSGFMGYGGNEFGGTTAPGSSMGNNFQGSSPMGAPQGGYGPANNQTGPDFSTPSYDSLDHNISTNADVDQGSLASLNGPFGLSGPQNQQDSGYNVLEGVLGPTDRSTGFAEYGTGVNFGGTPTASEVAQNPALADPGAGKFGLTGIESTPDRFSGFSTRPSSPNQFDEAPLINGDLVPQHGLPSSMRSPNFSMDPYSSQSLARPDVRWGNAVGMTENRAALARGDEEAFQAAVQNVRDRAAVNYSGYGPRVEDQARAPSQYSGINVRGQETPGTVKGALRDDPALTQEGYGLTKEVLSGQTPDITGGAMSFRGFGQQDNMYAHDPNAKDFGGNVFGNWNAEERGLAAQARAAAEQQSQLAINDTPQASVGIASLPGSGPIGAHATGEATYPDMSDAVLGQLAGDMWSPNFSGLAGQLSHEIRQDAPPAAAGPPAAPDLGEMPDLSAYDDVHNLLTTGNVPAGAAPAAVAAPAPAPQAAAPAPQAAAPAAAPVAAPASSGVPAPTPVTPNIAPPTAASSIPAQDIQPANVSPWVGKSIEVAANLGIGMIPGIGPLVGLGNTVSGLLGGPTIGSGLRSLVENGFPKGSAVGARNGEGNGYVEAGHNFAFANDGSLYAAPVKSVKEDKPHVSLWDHDQFYGPKYDETVSRLYGGR